MQNCVLTRNDRDQLVIEFIAMLRSAISLLPIWSGAQRKWRSIKCRRNVLSSKDLMDYECKPNNEVALNLDAI